MKKLVLLFSIILMSCSNDSDEGSNKDVTAFKAATFISDPFQEEQPDIWGAPMEPQTRMNVIAFWPGGHIYFFQVDENNLRVSGTSSTIGKYKLDFPRVYDIADLIHFSETQITIQTGSKMQFTAGGLIYKETSQEFD